MPANTTARRLRLLIVNPTIVSKREHLHIGIATVGSYVRAHSDHGVRILDFMAHRRTWRRRLRDEIRDWQPDLVAMYVSSPYFPVACEVAAEIKRLTPVPLVAGGHHPTLAPESVLAVPAFDWVIQGEGEIATLRLLDAMATGAPLSEVPGLWRREGGAYVGNPRALLLDPRDFPAIDWTLHDDETLRTNFRVWGILPVMASRGCPARCSFCSITNIQRLYAGQKFLRFRDPVAVIDEIEADFARFKPLGMRAVYFYDLNFLMNVKWLRAFTDEYRRRGLHRVLPWSAYTRPDHMTAAAAECLRDSGCNNLRVGIEAANPWMRNDVYRKHVSQRQLEEALRRIKDLGITVTGYFMAGGPGERPEWLLESLAFARRFGVEFPVFFLYQPLAGSDILERVAELGSRVREDVGEEAADFLHGVHMEHRNIASWQLSAFVLLTHAVFGARMVRWQAGRAGLRWVAQLARYAADTLPIGFTPYGAFTYFVYYGEDHLVAPFRAPGDPKPTLAWQGLMALARRMLPHSGAPDPASGASDAAPDSAPDWVPDAGDTDA